MNATVCRVLNQLAGGCGGNGPWNMAVDEALLQSAAATGRAAIRFYGWSVPTVSLGYFQRAADRAAHGPSGACALVRRMTGGGAIVHDRELTYSLALPAWHPLAADHQRLYLVVHTALIEALGEWGIRAELSLPGERPTGARLPFLCFLRRAPGDVLIGGVKLAGSAQRRRSGAVLQQGSVLLARSPAAPELPGIEEAALRQIAPPDLAQAWLARLQAHLGMGWCDDRLGADEQRQAERLVAQRYAAEQWTKKR